MTDSLSLYPEVVREEAMRTTGALLLIFVIAFLHAKLPYTSTDEINRHGYAGSAE